MQFQRLLAVGLGITLLFALVVSAISVVQIQETLNVLGNISERQEPVRSKFNQVERLINEASLRFVLFSRSDFTTEDELLSSFDALTGHLKKILTGLKTIPSRENPRAVIGRYLDPRFRWPPVRVATNTGPQKEKIASIESLRDFQRAAREFLLLAAKVEHEGELASEIHLASAVLAETEALFRLFMEQQSKTITDVVGPLNQALVLIEDMEADVVELFGPENKRYLEVMRLAIGRYKGAAVLFDDERQLDVSGANLRTILGQAQDELERSLEELHALQQVIHSKIIALQTHQQSAWENRRSIIFLVVGLAATFAVTSSLALHAVLKRRIGSLVVATREIAQGNLAFRTSPGPADQITEVASAINAMAEMLQERDQVLRESEEKLRHAQKMEVVGQLSGGVAHDFNNLLQVVLSNIEMAKTLHGEGGHMARFLDNALNAGVRGGELTRQLLAFSRKQNLYPATFDSAELVDGVVEILGRTLGEDIEIETAKEQDVPPIVVDRNAFENAVLNISINARAAMPNGGRLAISIARTSLKNGMDLSDDHLEPGDYVEISLADTGVGMSKETLEHAFEPFFTTREVGKGSGLGLSMVYGFIRQSGGGISIESEVGEGTVVRLLFPASNGENAATMATA